MLPPSPPTKGARLCAHPIHAGTRSLKLRADYTGQRWQKQNEARVSDYRSSQKSLKKVRRTTVVRHTPDQSTVGGGGMRGGRAWVRRGGQQK